MRLISVVIGIEMSDNKPSLGAVDNGDDVHSMAEILQRHRDEERQAAAIAKKGN
jgi:hypothetical protein